MVVSHTHWHILNSFLEEVEVNDINFLTVSIIFSFSNSVWRRAFVQFVQNTTFFFYILVVISSFTAPLSTNAQVARFFQFNKLFNTCSSDSLIIYYDSGLKCIYFFMLQRKVCFFLIDYQDKNGYNILRRCAFS